MRFSIVMPTMGERPEMIAESIESVLNQSFPDFELIIVNGGHDIEIPKDKRIKVIRQTGKGLGQALNQGFQEAKGEILNESNDDDLMAEKALEIVDKEIGDFKWLYGNIKYGADIYGRSWDYEGLKRHNYVPQPAVYFTKEVYKEMGPWEEQFELAADYEYWLRLGSKHEPKYIKNVLAHYTVHEGQITKTQTAKQLAHANEVKRKYL